VSLVDQHLGLKGGETRQHNLQLDLKAESLWDGTDRNRALYLDLWRDRQGIACGDILHGTQESGRVSGGKQLLRVGATPPGAPECAWRGELYIQHAIGRHGSPMTAASGVHLLLVEHCSSNIEPSFHAVHAVA
jgi:hypothetical protein